MIWRQTPKVTGRGHYSHRLTFSPDGKYLFIATGERHKMQPAQDTGVTLGKIVRLNLDGTPAAGNPLADKGGVSAEIWSWGHRNILGIDWDAQGRLWEVEHGPAGGDDPHRLGDHLALHHPFARVRIARGGEHGSDDLHAAGDIAEHGIARLPRRIAGGGVGVEGAHGIRHRRVHVDPDA